MELKEFIEDEDFISKMSKAFADLRADFELDLHDTEEKIRELRSTHVDYKNNLDSLVSCSTVSSGVISGLRGTGKTHLFLLARDRINGDYENCKVLCVYLNVKRLHLPEDYNQEIFNRVFSIYLYDNIAKQLVGFLKNLKEERIINKILSIFDNDKRKLYKNIENTIVKISEFKNIVKNGTNKLEELSIGNINIDESNRELIEIKNSILTKLSLSDLEVGNSLDISMLEELSRNMAKGNTYINFLNIYDVRQQLIEIKELLKLRSITFYVDEWEKLYRIKSAQEFLSFYIDKINDTPFYFWIGVVPNRGGLHHLQKGADLQHEINLDKNLKIELSSQDKEECIAYYKKFINQRLKYYFKELGISYTILIDKTKKLEMLILGSMGIPRDFGTILLDCWVEFKEYRLSKLIQGRPNKYITESMIIKAIRNDGEKKISNISDNIAVMQVWRDLENFATNKKSSHICIETSRDNIEILSKEYFSELIYHRLLHFRKGHVPPKDKEIKNKLAVYALSYSCTYDLHQKDKLFSFVTEYETIHDKVRRYIYNPKAISNYIDIKEGEIILCKSEGCRQEINLHKMKHAVSSNECPFCGSKLFNH
ncbi:hypothetical protein SAMN05660297_02951 [Natronincola peptidivorans]|uniref:Uncharacterized protein n=1 Tax=Natronincola peptidivorans TaxID=426128 RepID=A0A1I0FTW9_9FIRM|nr:hypothetical protein [Natronincola peptidivorans]SET61897.1 hypothetical protein SAMN05660297_02951 [Natronincola peptidivorans]